MSLNAGAVVAQFKADISGMKSGIAAVKSEVGGLGSSFSQAGSQMASAGSAIATFGAVAGAALLYAGVKAASAAGDFEQNRVAFENMLGSAEKAQEVLKNVSDFAAVTPFELPEVVAGGKQLLAYGVSADNLIPTLTKVGDAASKMGVPIQQAIDVWAKAKAGMFEIREFAPLGVTRENIAKYGVEFDKAGAVVDRSKLLPALEKMWGSEGTVGMMAKQSKTLKGVTSNLMDDMGRISRGILGISDTGDIRDGSIFFYLKNAAADLLAWLDAHKDQIIQFFTDIVNTVKDWGGKIAAFLQPAIEWLKKFFSDVENRKALFIAIVAGVGVLLATALIAFIAAHAVVIVIVAAVMAVVGLFARAWASDWGNIREITAAVWNALKIIFGAIWAMIQTYIANMKRSFDAWVALFVFLKDTVTTVFSAIGAVFTWIWGTILKPFIDNLVGAFKFWASIFSWCWNNVIFPLLYLAAAVFAKVFLQIYNDHVKPMVDKVAAVLAWLGDKINFGFAAMALFVSVVWQKIKDSILTPINNAKDGAVSIFDALKQAVQDKWNALKDWFVGMKDAIWQAIVAPFSAAKKDIEDIAQKIKDAADKINPFHKESPSLVEWVTLGVGKIKDQYGDLYSTIKGMDFRKNLADFSSSMQISPVLGNMGAGGLGSSTTVNQYITNQVADTMDVDALNSRLAFKYRTA